MVEFKVSSKSVLTAKSAEMRQKASQNMNTYDAKLCVQPQLAPLYACAVIRPVHARVNPFFIHFISFVTKKTPSEYFKK